MKSNFYKQFLLQFEPQYQAHVDKLTKQFVQGNLDESSKLFFEPMLPLSDGGKRLRPYLVALGADSLDQSVLDAGSAIELLHLFALVHDDIMDGATMRRNKPTAHVAYEAKGVPGISGAILLGDYLLGYANYVMATSNTQLMAIFCEIQCFLCLGQFYEVAQWGKPTTREVAEQIELFKSGQYTFMYPLRVGLAKAGKDIHLLDNYAHYIGLAFQIKDDWLDITDEETGKDKGLDGKNQINNVVQIFLKENNGEKEKTKVIITNVLTEYKAKALENFPKDQLSPQQQELLLDILDFFTVLH